MEAMQRSNSPLDPGSIAPPRPGGWGRWLILCAALVAGHGCYTYQTTDLRSLVPGREIRVEVGSDQFVSRGHGSAFLSPRRVEGRFADLTEQSLVLSIWIGSGYRETPFETARQNLQIPLADLAQVSTRQISRGRTALAATGTLAVIWYLIDTLRPAPPPGGDENGDGPPTPPEFRPFRSW